MVASVPALRSRQRGVALVLFTIGTLAILAVAGLAIDLGLAYVAKTRVQNAVDAAALTGAKHLNTFNNTSLATTAALSAYALNDEGLDEDVTPVVEMSPTLSPFIPGGLNPRFVRVTVTGMPSPLRFASVLPGIGSSINVGGVAVAGPIPLGTTCHALPIAMCGTPGDEDCSDGKCFGLGPGSLQLKTDDKKLGPGNYGLVVLECVGADCLRESMAGGGDFCFAEGGTVTTEPGGSAGPTAQGLNTRFGLYQGPVSQTEYPPDVVTRYVPELTYALYQTALATPALWNNPPPAGVAERRVAIAPIVDCTPPINGRKNASVIGAACIFLLRPVDGGNGTIHAQIAPSCEADGEVPETPGESSAYKIVLYQNAP